MPKASAARRSRILTSHKVSAICLLVLAWAARSGAQTTQDRTVLPIAKTPYTNQVGTSYKDSIAQKHAPVTAPAGAPNILLILIDDAGYGQTSTFGAPIPTPTLDKLAQDGLRYTRFHVTALCSPSRAALLTGRNHHSVGMGTLTNYGTGFPGYDGDIPKSAAFVSETLRENGYSTSAFGKWHLAPDWETSPVGPFDHWPTGQGFDNFYGFIGGQSDQWNPELYQDTQPTAMSVPPGREGHYTLNDSLADHAIAWIQQEKSITPDRPFFIYYAPGATHSPLQAPQEWIDKFHGKFDMGWDRYREMVFEQQKRLGVIPADTVLTPRPAELPAWDTLSPDQKKVAARLMEIFAAYMAQSDYEIGRIVDEIAATGQLDNTLIFYIAGDNGASLEGGLYGTSDDMATINGAAETTAQIVQRLDALGGPDSRPHYPAAWAWAGNTPFQWGKQFASHLGGTRDPLVVSWPARITKTGGVRSQFEHLIDIAPTILEAANLPQPTSVDGAVQQPIEGVSMLDTFNNPDAPSHRTTQYFEMYANRAIYHDGWIAGARSGKLPWVHSGEFDFEKQPWELYDIRSDYSESHNLATAQPEKLREMQDLFAEQAKKFHVYPLDPRNSERANPALRPSLTEGRTTFTYTTGLQLYDSLAPIVRNRSHTITAQVNIPAGGAEGVIVAQGAGCGYSLYLKDSRPTYAYNFCGLGMTTITSSAPLPSGPAVIEVEFAYDGGGLGKGATATMLVNGKPVGSARIPRTVPISFSYDETFDIGHDAGKPVGDYAGPFVFTGSIRKVVIDLAPNHLSSSDIHTLNERETKSEQTSE